MKAYKYLKNCVDTNDLTSAANALKDSFSSMTMDDLKVSIKQYIGIDAWTNNPEMTLNSFNKLIEVCSGAGMTNATTDYSKVVNTEIAKKVMEKIA